MDLEKILEIGFQAKIPMFLWGPPGIGKTSRVKRFAQEKGLPVIDLRLSQMSPVDLRGVPYPDKEKGYTVFYPPAELPRIERDGPEGILFLDEFPNAVRDIQAAALQILDGRLGLWEKPPGWWIVLAGNRVSDRAGAYQILSSVANRLCHIPVGGDLPPLEMEDPGYDGHFDAWKIWALRAGIREEVISYLNYQPRHLYAVTKQVAYATPRSWEMVSRALNYGVNETVIAGCVGTGVAGSFRAFLKVRQELPDPDKVLAGEKVDLPVAPDALYAMLGALVHRAIRAEKTAEIGQKPLHFARVIKRFPPEFQALGIGDLVKAKAQKFLASLFAAPEGLELAQKLKAVLE